MNVRLLFFSIFTAAFFASCDLYPQDEFRQNYVVEAYMVADRQLPTLRLSTTSPTNAFYSFEDNAISEAAVEIRLLEEGESSAVEQVFSYTNQRPGIFEADQNHAVLPLRAYELVISITGTNDEIRSSTIIPGRFSVVNGVQDSVVYQSPEQPKITVSRSEFPGRQNIFVFTTVSLNPTLDNLTELYLDFSNIDEESDSAEIATELNNLALTSSGIVNEANFDQNSDGSITLRYPWLAAAFYEENQIVASTIDNNMFDFMRSQDVQLGGSTLSPGEIQNVIYNIEGGIGIFGALASDTVRTFIKRNPALEF